jgi:hypothetical protein
MGAEQSGNGDEASLALRARSGKLRLEPEEVAKRVAAVDAERNPVAERFAPLLLDPVPSDPCHDAMVRPGSTADSDRGRADAVDRVRSRQPDDGRSRHGRT